MQKAEASAPSAQGADTQHTLCSAEVQAEGAKCLRGEICATLNRTPGAGFLLPCLSWEPGGARGDLDSDHMSSWLSVCVYVCGVYSMCIRVLICDVWMCGACEFVVCGI